jgi:inorganic triphosphatase YgiF
MSPTPSTVGTAAETELKLLLPGADPAHIAEQLGRHPLLRRRPLTLQRLHNQYFDTPEQELRQHKVALRVRRIDAGQGVPERWVQTFKTAGVSVGGMSRRGEWESDIDGQTPQLAALAGSPWPDIDADGALWPRLGPAFVTECTRSLWTVRRRDHSEIEVALDVGEIRAGGACQPLCELELELKQGQPEALLALAMELAQGLALLPGQASKAERGYALAAGLHHQPRRAAPPVLPGKMPLRVAAQAVLSEAWDQTQRNLALLQHEHAPEALHQARVGWRRWRSALRLFREVLPPPPSDAALRDFWRAGNPLRELDVACTQTLPAWRARDASADAPRQAQWNAAALALEQARQHERKNWHAALCAPELGQAWLQWGAWLATLEHAATGPAPGDLGDWARQRLRRLRDRLHRLDDEGASDAQRHRQRLLAKRLRYNTLALASVLPKGKARRWQQRAEAMQRDIGLERDLRQAVDWLARLDAPAAPLAFMQGVLAGRTGP